MKAKILVAATLLLIVSCGKKKPTTKETPMHNFVSTFEGQIDNSMDIIASLTCKDNKITGKYRYKGQSADLDISGEFYVGDSLKFTEYNKKGSLTGSFVGIYQNNKIDGKWSNAKGDKSLPFYLLQSNSQYPTSNSNDEGGQSSDENTYSNNGDNSEDGLRNDLYNKEKSHPKDYLFVYSEFKETGLFGGEYNVSGEVTNSATMITVKDIVITLIYYTETSTELKREDRTIYKYLQPNSSLKFKFDVKLPKNCKRVEAEYKSCTVE